MKNMKNFNFILCIMLCAVLLGVCAAMASSETVTATIVNYKIDCDNYPYANEELEYPLLSYNDRTYMALRDVAKVFYKDVHWFPEEGHISLVARKQERIMVQNEETAMAIGKAIIEQFYAGRLNETSQYYVGIGSYQNTTMTDYFYVCVMFNVPPDAEVEDIYIINNCDVLVEINPINAKVLLSEKRDGVWIHPPVKEYINN